MTLPTPACGVATAVGQRRLNEDSVIAQFPVYAVADGMGGHEAGEVASGIAVRSLAQFAGRQSVTVDDVASALKYAGVQVHAIPTAPGLGAGTTVTGVCLTEQDGEPYWLVFNVGDSRTYLLSNGEFAQVSVDHSEVQEMIDSGDLAPEDAVRYRRRNVITRALGADVALEPDFWLIPLGHSDRVLMCSDGLSSEVGHDELRDLLLSNPDPQVAAEELVAHALAAGGRDNVSALVVDAGAREEADDTVPRPSDVDGDEDDTLPTGVFHE